VPWAGSRLPGRRRGPPTLSRRFAAGSAGILPAPGTRSVPFGGSAGLCEKTRAPSEPTCFLLAVFQRPRAHARGSGDAALRAPEPRGRHLPSLGREPVVVDEPRRAGETPALPATTLRDRKVSGNLRRCPRHPGAPLSRASKQNRTFRNPRAGFTEEAAA
jgi:hypothetical protein